jgi:hypothetical protein
LFKVKPPAPLPARRAYRPEGRAYAPEGKAKILTAGIHNKYFQD